MPKKRPGDSPWKAVAIAGAVGVDLAVWMAAGYWAGSWAVDRGGHPVWIVVGIMAGFMVGVATVVLLLLRLSRDSHG